jgi:Protein of unknown function (DUF3421)
MACGTAGLFGVMVAASAAGPLALQPAPPVERVQFNGGANWMPASGGAIPPGAIQGGYESGGEPLYVCHVSYNDSVQPGKVRQGFGGCNFPFGGQEVTLPQYEVLVGTGFGWVPGSGGSIPGRAVQGGYDVPPQSPPLFVCQANYNGGVHPGKIRSDWTSCDISWGGREIFIPAYNVLVR